mmetsp:Transcript_87458/g.199874  ORF Transcript_87458/g.199874 Transcript_87458/m.199874 type:complete len:275 (+) Transcript_87458:192-1016(+)
MASPPFPSFSSARSALRAASALTATSVSMEAPTMTPPAPIRIPMTYEPVWSASHPATVGAGSVLAAWTTMIHTRASGMRARPTSSRRPGIRRAIMGPEARPNMALPRAKTSKFGAAATREMHPPIAQYAPTHTTRGLHRAATSPAVILPAMEKVPNMVYTVALSSEVSPIFSAWTACTAKGRMYPNPAQATAAQVSRNLGSLNTANIPPSAAFWSEADSAGGSYWPTEPTTYRPAMHAARTLSPTLQPTSGRRTRARLAQAMVPNPLPVTAKAV